MHESSFSSFTNVHYITRDDTCFLDSKMFLGIVWDSWSPFHVNIPNTMDQYPTHPPLIQKVYMSPRENKRVDKRLRKLISQACLQNLSICSAKYKSSLRGWFSNHQPMVLEEDEMFYYVGGLRMTTNSRTQRKGSKFLYRT